MQWPPSEERLFHLTLLTFSFRGVFKVLVLAYYLLWLLYICGHLGLFEIIIYNGYYKHTENTVAVLVITYHSTKPLGAACTACTACTAQL